MKLESSAFSDGKLMPEKYSCDREGISPPLNIVNAPDNAETFVLIVEDPDAPRRVFQHWIVWNISGRVKQIDEDSVPEGSIEGLNDFGGKGYGAPCPPSSMHRYIFRIYALDVSLKLDVTSSREQLNSAMDGHIIASAVLTGKYRRI